MNIIAVDDNISHLKGLEGKIREAVSEAEVVTFHKTTPALEYVGQNKVDIAFLDIEMRGMTGIELAMKIKMTNPDCNIIYVTGYSNYAFEAMATRPSGYLLKPASLEDIKRELEELRKPLDTEPVEKNKLRIQTFGSFQVFDEKNEPIQFSRKYAKEILAYLVDKKGFQVSSKDIADEVLEYEGFDAKISKEVSKYVITLMQDLKEAGYGQVIIKTRNTICIDTNCVDCDFYRLLEGDPQAINQFHGEYMIDYSWAEVSYGEFEQI